MARPRQDGLLYFSFDTDFFYADKRIKRLHSKYGSDGLIFYIYLLTEIYRNGYYISWDEEAVEDAAADLRLKEGFIRQAMAYLTSRSLLTKLSILAGPVTASPTQKAGNDGPQREFAEGGNGRERAEVITSPGIQKRYQEAVKGRKRQFEVDSQIWLLKKEETASCIKITNKYSFSDDNPSKSGKNPDNSEKNPVKESKVNKNKTNKAEGAADPPNRFSEFWSAYPKKANEAMAKKEYGRVLTAEAITEGDLIQAAKNYAEACAIEERAERYVKAPANWLKDSTWVDYAPENYKRPQAKAGRGNNAFNDYPHRGYDIDAIKKRMFEG